MKLNKIIAKGVFSMFDTPENDKDMWELLINKSIAYLGSLPNSAISRILQSKDNIDKLSNSFLKGVDTLEADQVVRALNGLSDVIRTVTDNKDIVRPTSLSKAMYEIKELYRCIDTGKCQAMGNMIHKPNGEKTSVSSEIINIVKNGVKDAHVEMLGNDPALYLGMSLLGCVSGMIFDTDTDIMVKSTHSDVVVNGDDSNVEEREVMIKGIEAIRAMNTGGF